MRRIVVAAGAALVLLLTAAGVSSAQLAIPAARIFGSITVNGQNAPAGSVVAAYAGYALCGVTTGTGLYNGQQYFLDLDGTIAACATPGSTLTFTVNGVPANEAAYVPDLPGTAVLVNLSVGGYAPVPLYAPPPPSTPPPPPPGTGSYCHGRHCRHHGG